MDICFITNYTLDYVWQNNLNDLQNQDVVVFSFNGIGLVNYKKELAGETEYFSDIAKLSKQISSVVISGCDTDTYGTFRHSCVIAEKGKILGVVDMNHSIDDSEYVSGGGYKVFDTNIGKIGIIVMEDIFFFDSSKILSLCDADIIFCIYKNVNDSIPEIMVRANAYSNGIMLALCGENVAFMSDIRGKIIMSSYSNIIKTKVKIEKDYHLISSRCRGLYRDFKS